MPLFAFLVAFLALAIAAPAAQTNAVPRPNILFCLADDWSWPHAGAYGDTVIRTPVFDRLAKQGALFTHAFSAVPSCTPSRAAILTGRAAHELGEGANLYGPLPRDFAVYPNLLEKAGYVVGFTRKGWAPGDYAAGDRKRNPAGPSFKDFKTFLASKPAGKPFCFWFGSHQPHRPYEEGIGLAQGLKPGKVKVPSFWPDCDVVRRDILDYYATAERVDQQVGELMEQLRESGELTNTLVVITGDNGWPFPRAKANLYDAGTRQPLLVYWPARIKKAQRIDTLVNLYDLAPTFLEAAGLAPLPQMRGQSLLGLFDGKTQAGRDCVFLERERHANARRGNLSYPARAIRTKEFLYIRNLRPDRWPAGDPEGYWSVGPFGDCDASPTKQFIMDHRDEPKIAKYFERCFAKRPAEELYDLKRDPEQLNNVATNPKYAGKRQELRERLDRWMKETHDPRWDQDDDRWDRYEYSGPKTIKE